MDRIKSEVRIQIGKELQTPGKCLKSIYYIEQVNDPEFGCEGRPEGKPVYGTIKLLGKTGEKIVQIEEKVLWKSGLDDNMWIGISMEESENNVWYAYDAKYDKLILLENDVLLYINGD